MMRVVTYLGFTVLSIFIQFSVMDFIQDKIQVDGSPKGVIEDEKENINDLLKNISNNPHALYYRTNRALKKPAPNKEAKTNSPLIEVPLSTTTDVSTTVLEILYDENTSDIEPSTTEVFTTTELDNVTELPLFDTKNKSIHEGNVPYQISSTEFCGCNLLFKVCDVNCCCDPDCNVLELNVFECENITNKITKRNEGCISYLINEYKFESTMLDNLFCVVKTNLPTKRKITKYNVGMFDRSYKWKHSDQSPLLYEFKKTSYKKTDPIWLLKNGTLYYLDYPLSTINNYCTDRKPVTFLKQENIRCNVNLKDLEIFNINNLTKEAVVISATENTINASTVNCSNAHCTNLTVYACNNTSCVLYNTSLNQATCMKTICTNIALQIDYDFYFFNSKIINASVKLYIQNISAMVTTITQEINVKFHMNNKSTNVLKLSGNPGYIKNLPLIVSYARRNYTEDFFNNTLEANSRLFYPENMNGLCVMSNKSINAVTFDTNKMTRCRYKHTVYRDIKNNTNLCKNIQDNINKLLGLNKNISISPFGNPNNVSDDGWIKLHNENEDPLYGTFNDKKSKLRCYNFVPHFSVIFVYAKVEEHLYEGQNKILFAKYVPTPKNLSFNIEDISTIVSMDVFYVDVTKPSLIEYATSPQLNINLPKDFFFPFPSNSCSSVMYNNFVLCVTMLILNKITLE